MPLRFWSVYSIRLFRVVPVVSSFVRVDINSVSSLAPSVIMLCAEFVALCSIASRRVLEVALATSSNPSDVAVMASVNWLCFSLRWPMMALARLSIVLVTTTPSLTTSLERSVPVAVTLVKVSCILREVSSRS